MKKETHWHEAKKRVHRGIACLLCLGALLPCFSVIALGAETTEAAAIAEEDAAQTETETVSDEAAGENSSDAEQEDGTLPAKDTVTLTFKLGKFGTETLTVENGQCPTEVPEIPELAGATVLGWYDASGNPADPTTIPATEDATYTARWSRQVAELLNTDEHIAYISGYSNGMFRPNNSMTRAEAAQMIYTLLRDQTVEQSSFPDVGTRWYATAVGTMAGLGILQGYADGTFRANNAITRAEFVAMVVNCDTITGGEVPFSDVSSDSWAAPYIATAAANGWITGYPDGTFHPNEKITRAQAVTILNKVLGRTPDAAISSKKDVKSFYDVFTDTWAYANIVEASTTHSFELQEETEVWTDYEPDADRPTASKWVKDGSSLYYLDASTGKFLRGQQTIGGKVYYLDAATGAAYTGWRTVNGWRRYYKNGEQLEDISGMGLVSGPYYIKVYKNSNYLIIFAQDSSGSYNTPVRAMRASCGETTIVGTYRTPMRFRWLNMIDNTWGQWCTQIYGNFLFHSVPNYSKSNNTLEVEEYNHLGETRSLGCVRLNCEDAKWIYDNCVLGTVVTITDTETSGPLSKPSGITIPSWHTWDPTDPTAYWLCKQKGCH
jgi:hypothetical protein